MYDSVHPANWPADGDLYAGYVGGSWPTFTNGSALAHAGGKPVVSIAVASRYNATVLDVESGDATPDLAPAWVQRQRWRGQEPTVYCELSALPTVQRAFRTAQVPEPWYWIAAYSKPAGSVFAASPRVVAHQYGGDRGAGWDISAVADHWPGVDQEDDLTGEQAQQLTNIENMLTLLAKGADGFGVDATPVDITKIWKAIEKIAVKVGVDL